MSDVSTTEGPIAWVNGEILPFQRAVLPVWDLGVVAGASISEMARTYRHAPFRIEQHLKRFIESCEELGFPLAYSIAELKKHVEEVVRVNSGRISPNSDLGIVIFCTAGSNATYLGGDSRGGTTCIHTFPLPFEMWKPAMERGVALTTPPTVQVSSRSLPTHRKVRNRLHWWLADREANEIEPGSRALLLNSDGLIAETSTSCFYAVIDGMIKTPGTDVLHSTTRQIVEELAADLDIPFEQTDLTLADLETATEAFLSSTPCGLLPVRTINKKSIGTDVPGPVFTQLQTAWTQLTGLDTIKQILEN